MELGHGAEWTWVSSSRQSFSSDTPSGEFLAISSFSLFICKMGIITNVPSRAVGGLKGDKNTVPGQGGHRQTSIPANLPALHTFGIFPFGLVSEVFVYPKAVMSVKSQLE